MMKFHKPGRLRQLGGAVAIATLGGLSLAFGSAAAQPAPPASAAPPAAGAPANGERHEERVIVRTYRHDGDGDRQGAARERHGSDNDVDGDRRVERNVRIITTDRHGGDGEHVRVMEGHGPGHMTMLADGDCRNAYRSEVNEGNDNNRTRVIVCTRTANGEANPGQQVEALQRTRERLSGDSEIPAEQRQRVLAAIDREIARLRGGQ